MSLKDKKSPLDPAPDWVDKTFGQRLSDCAMQLFMFGMVTEKEAKDIYDRINMYISKRE